MTSTHTPGHVRAVLRRHSNADAARLLGITRERARQLRLQYEVPVPKADDQRREILRALRRGEPTADIAARFGIGARQVRRIRQEAGIPVRPRPVEHGTRNGYAWHMRRGEPACAPCLEANRADQAERRAAG